MTGTSQLFHSDPGHSPIHHSSTKLYGESQTIRGGGLKAEHWNTFIVIFYWRDPNKELIYWGLITTLTGWGFALTLMQVPHSFWVLGGGSAVAPLLKFKGLVCWVLEHSCHMCSQPWQL